MKASPGNAAMISRRKLAALAAVTLAVPFIRPARAAHRLRLGITQNANSHYGFAATKLAQVIQTDTDGRVQVEIFRYYVAGTPKSPSR